MRICAVASRWMGRPLLLICIVTTASWVLLPSDFTEVTWPTSTPAIRTGEGMWSSVSVVNTALSTNGEPDHGVGPPNTRYTTATITKAAMIPAAKFEIGDRRPVAPHFLLPVVVSVVSPTLPDGFPIAAAAPEYGSFPAAHSAVSPGESVFGYGLTWSGPCSAVGTVTGVV